MPTCSGCRRSRGPFQVVAEGRSAGGCHPHERGCYGTVRYVRVHQSLRVPGCPTSPLGCGVACSPTRGPGNPLRFGPSKWSARGRGSRIRERRGSETDWHGGRVRHLGCRAVRKTRGWAAARSPSTLRRAGRRWWCALRWHRRGWKAQLRARAGDWRASYSVSGERSRGQPRSDSSSLLLLFLQRLGQRWQTRKQRRSTRPRSAWSNADPLANRSACPRLPPSRPLTTQLELTHTHTARRWNMARSKRGNRNRLVRPTTCGTTNGSVSHAPIPQLQYHG